MQTPVDLLEHFVEVPPIARAWRLVAQPAGVSLTKLKAPFSNGFIFRDTPRIANISSTSRKLRAKIGAPLFGTIPYKDKT